MDGTVVFKTKFSFFFEIVGVCGGQESQIYIVILEEKVYDWFDSHAFTCLQIRVDFFQVGTAHLPKDFSDRDSLQHEELISS